MDCKQIITVSDQAAMANQDLYIEWIWTILSSEVEQQGRDLTTKVNG